MYLNNWPEKLQEYAVDIADRRMGDVEQMMQRSPDDYPEYTAARENIAEQEQALMDKLHCVPFDFDGLECAFNAVNAALAIQVYLQGVQDGGRMYHAFITGELPKKQE